MDIQELIEGWDRGDGKPMKGSLIDIAAWKSGSGYCAMCAQGQVLHVVGGWSTDRLADAEQEDADKETAKLLRISRAHAVLLRNVNDRVDGAPAIVLTDPGAVLGDQWSKLLDFWWHLDTLNDEDWRRVVVDWYAAGYAAGVAAGYSARAAAGVAARGAAGYAAGVAAGYSARAAAGVAAGAAAWDAAGDAAWAAAGVAAGSAAGAAAGDASNEIQGAEILKRDGKQFFYLPMFGFASPDDIPARPTDYGVVA